MMKEFSNKCIEEIVDKINSRLEGGQKLPNIKEDLLPEVNLYYSDKAVLGFDIYRYSQYEKLEQTLIPYAFKVLLDVTVENVLEYEPFFFQGLNKDSMLEKFIDAGDGGFLIFDTPFQAVIFAIFFQTNIKRYNSGHDVTQKVRNIIGELNLRYSLTFDNTYYSNGNFYGPSIINNARIMGKDKLNRFLLDHKSVQWFNKELNGIENLQSINIEKEHKKIEIFKSLNPDIKNPLKTMSLLLSKSNAIISVDIMHIGEIKSKLDILNIYSTHIQAALTSQGSKSFEKYTISLGNLNSSGLV